MLVSNSQVLEFFRGKKVFITGHTGFKGSWLSLLLTNAGATVKGYALAPDHADSLFENLAKKLDMESVIADIRDENKLQSEIESFQPEFIFHLAAQPLVRYSYVLPLMTFEVNVLGTIHVLEAMRKAKHACTAVIVTTDKVYENNESGKPFVESDPLGGHDPYSSSKAAAEIVCQSYSKSFFPPANYTEHQKAIATARAGNVIGGGDRSSDRIIPDLVNSLEKGLELKLRNPEAVRPWQHVLDPLTGYLKLAFMLHADPNKYAGGYNFGPYPEDQLSVKELVELAIKTHGTGTYKVTPPTQQLHEASHLRLDITKALTHLDWKPKWNAKEAVERTMRWYGGNFKNNFSDYSLCIQDIADFNKI